MAASKEIVGKKTIVVDKNSFLDLARDSFGQIPSGLYEVLGGSYLPFADVDTVRLALGKYWDYNVPLTSDTNPLSILPNTKIFNNDHLKLNVFCNTPLSLKDCDPGEQQATPGNLIYADPETGGSVEEDGAAPWTPMIGYSEKFYLECSVPGDKFVLSFNEYVTTDDPIAELDHDINFWVYLMKYGIKVNGQHLPPIIKSLPSSLDSPAETMLPFLGGNAGDYIVYDVQDGNTTKKINYYYDHYHESLSPFTLAELEQEEPYGKAYFADYKAYYNDRVDYGGSGAPLMNYENLIAGSFYQNSIPNVYSFIKIINNQELAENGAFALNEIVYGGADYINSYNDNIFLRQYYAGSGQAVAASAIYTTLFKYYPLEASLLLYGSPGIYSAGPAGFNPAGVGPNSPSRLLKINPKTIDATALFNDYINDWTFTMHHDSNMSKLGIDTDNTSANTNRIGVSPLTKLGALEYIASNLVFSPEALPALKEVSQFKKHFPMYFEMNFTAQLETLIGDYMKKTHLTKTLASQVVAMQETFGSTPETDLKWSRFSQDTSTSYEFVDYMNKNVYENLIDSNFVSIPALNGEPYAHNSKKVIPLVNRQKTGILDKIADKLNFSFLNSHESTTHGWNVDGTVSGWHIGPEDVTYPPVKDLRNYMSYVNYGPPDASHVDNDCNTFFQFLFTSALKQKLINVYEEKRRSYREILDGVPAYTEDLFYLIKKYRRDETEGLERCVQNIIIPNTSDLNIVEYIDTQVKYGKDATYRYEVYAERVVFGSKYRYYYDEAGSSTKKSFGVPADAIDSQGNLDNLFDPAISTSPGFLPPDYEQQSTRIFTPADGVRKYTITFHVDVEPSIILVEDKIFSTDDIKVLDNPPVPPDVNIVPYRANSKKLKIILGGTSDSYRDIPINILDEDEAIFNLIKESQFFQPPPYGDGKIEFSSDDKVKGFQIFRIENRPISYNEFLPHPDGSLAQIDGSTAAFDDSVLPNKKYYYTFRTIDYHDHISNPSSVYEVELIDEHGAVKPIIRTIDMTPRENKLPTAECQKYILLKPSAKQLYFPDQETTNSIFSTDDANNRKKFKMRLISKGSGKKIDINFSFVKKITTPAPTLYPKVIFSDAQKALFEKHIQIYKDSLGGPEEPQDTTKTNPESMGDEDY